MPYPRALRLTGLALVAALALVACDRTPPTADGGEPARIPVEVERVTQGSITAAWRGTATLVAHDEADIVAKVGGEVLRVPVEEGDRVAAGAVLAQLDTERFRLEANRVAATVEQREAEMRRSEQLLERNMVSREAHERTLFELQTARADRDLAQLTVREATIRAPFDGVVAARMVQRGNTVAAGEVVFRVTQPDRLEAEVFVPERDVARLAAGQTARVRADGRPGETFEAEIARISPVVDAASGTVKVTLAVDAAEGALRPGMFTRVEIVYDRRENATLVPADAILSEDGANTVFVVRDGVARRTPLQLGVAEAGLVEVIEGLAPGDRVVVTGQAALRDGAEVLVVNDDEIADEAADAADTADAASDEATTE
jgi:membrane fusion protein (multidrug efflux system)